MPRPASTLSDKYAARLRTFDRARRKLEHLHNPEGRLTRHDVSLFYEGIFLRTVTSFERLLEDLFVGLLAGGITPGRNVHPRVTFQAYAVAREFSPLLVNTVVGFIGPEYLYDGKQIIRAGLEDHFCGKLLGLPMGVDVCYTNHAAADQNSADNLLVLLAAAGCNYFMGVPCADDVMLNYQSTSYHDAAAVRRLFGLRPAPEFLAWLEERGVFRGGRLLPADDGRRRLLQLAAPVLVGGSAG